MEIILNGKPEELAAGMTLAALVERLGKTPVAVAVERNGEIVPRAEYAATELEPGDRLEVVQFVQGGSGSGPAGLAKIGTSG